MKTKIILLLLTIAVFSCKHSNPTSGKINLPFDTRAFSVNNFALDGSATRKKLLHEVYITKKNLPQNESDKIVSSEQEDIKDDINYNKNFAKLIISYSDREELFYIPDGLKKEDIFTTLSLKLNKEKKWIWKSELKKGQTAYLIEASPREVLLNEANFAITHANTLEIIYPFQAIEVELRSAMATPTFGTEKIMEKVDRCYEPETPSVCECYYSKTVPSGGYSAFTTNPKESVSGSLLLNQTSQSIIFNKVNEVYIANILPDVSSTELAVFKIDLPMNEAFQFVSNYKTCGKRLNQAQAFTLNNQFQYTLNYKITGVNETLTTFGELPTQI
jgi:hypothetical protein